MIIGQKVQISLRVGGFGSYAGITGLLPDDNGNLAVANSRFLSTHFAPGLGQASLTGKGHVPMEEARSLRYTPA
jgi:hypothetical protein